MTGRDRLGPCAAGMELEAHRAHRARFVPSLFDDELFDDDPVVVTEEEDDPDGN